MTESSFFLVECSLVEIVDAARDANHPRVILTGTGAMREHQEGRRRIGGRIVAGHLLILEGDPAASDGTGTAVDTVNL